MAEEKQKDKKNEKEESAPKVVKKKKSQKNVHVGIVHVYSSFNNIMINITDPQGNTVVLASAGAQGFKGAKKSTPYAAQVTAEAAGRQAQELGMKTVSVEIKGPGSGRESAIRALMGLGFVITTIKDITSIAHNGPRPPKRRRI